MKTLEEILAEYFGVSVPFNQDGTLTDKGSQAYNGLLSLMYDLYALGVVYDYEHIVRELDKILTEVACVQQ